MSSFPSGTRPLRVLVRTPPLWFRCQSDRPLVWYSSTHSLHKPHNTLFLAVGRGYPARLLSILSPIPTKSSILRNSSSQNSLHGPGHIFACSLFSPIVPWPYLPSLLISVHAFLPFDTPCCFVNPTWYHEPSFLVLDIEPNLLALSSTPWNPISLEGRSFSPSRWPLPASLSRRRLSDYSA